MTADEVGRRPRGDGWLTTTGPTSRGGPNHHDPNHHGPSHRGPRRRGPNHHGHHPSAPLVGASTVGQIDDAVASLAIDLSSDEIRALEAHYTPRYDFQGISDDTALQAIMARLPQFTTTSVA